MGKKKKLSFYSLIVKEIAILHQMGLYKGMCIKESANKNSLQVSIPIINYF